MDIVGLLALICPGCGQPLDSAPERRILVCRSCGRTVTAAGDGRSWRPVPRVTIAPRIRPEAGAELILLPLWRIRVRTQELGAVGARMAEEIRLPAVGVQRLPLLLQFARNLTRAPIEAEIWEGIDVAVEPAELTAEDAFTLAETIALRHVDGWPDDASLPDLEIPLGSAQLVDWPCARFGSEIIDLVGGISTHRAFVEGVLLRDVRPALATALEDVLLRPGASR